MTDKKTEIDISGLSDEDAEKLIKLLEENSYSGCIKKLTTVEKIKMALRKLFR